MPLRLVVLVHNTRSNDSQSDETQFIHKLHLFLHAINTLTGECSLYRIEKLKGFTEQFKPGLISLI